MTDTGDTTPPSSSRERRTAGADPTPAPEPSSSSTTAPAEAEKTTAEAPKRKPGTYDVKDGPTARARRAERQAAEAEAPAE